MLSALEEEMVEWLSEHPVLWILGLTLVEDLGKHERFHSHVIEE